MCGVAALHADVYAATGRGGLVRVQNDVWRKNEIDIGKGGAADWQIVKQVFVHEIGDVADDRLRVHVVG